MALSYCNIPHFGCNYHAYIIPTCTLLPYLRPRDCPPPLVSCLPLPPPYPPVSPRAIGSGRVEPLAHGPRGSASVGAQRGHQEGASTTKLFLFTYTCYLCIFQKYIYLTEWKLSKCKYFLFLPSCPIISTINYIHHLVVVNVI